MCNGAFPGDRVREIWLQKQSYESHLLVLPYEERYCYVAFPFIIMVDTVHIYVFIVVTIIEFTNTMQVFDFKIFPNKNTPPSILSKML